jgi:hypothetical protein
MSNAYTAENVAAREALAALIDRLSDAQLSQPMDAGWTVASVLAHLAFWDQRAVTLLRQWKAQGVTPSPIDTDLINEVTRILFLAYPSRAAAELFLRCAGAIDREIDGLDPAFLADVETNGPTVVLNRGRHRRTHLAEIKQALGLAE